MILVLQKKDISENTFVDECILLCMLITTIENEVPEK